MKRTNYNDFQRMWGGNENSPKPKNYADWGDTARTEWENRPIEEVESYYINLKNYIAKLKKDENKPHALIHKKKLWRNGLKEILMKNPITARHYGPPQKKQKTSHEVQGTVRAMPTRVLATAEKSNPGATSLITEVDEMLGNLYDQRARRAAARPPPTKPNDEENEEAV